MSASSLNNRLLRSLGAASLDKLLPMLSKVPLRLKDPIDTRGQPTQQVYFPETGMISVVVQAGNKAAEAGLVGFDGVTGTHALLGNAISPNDCVVQLAGEGYRMLASDFIRFAAEEDSFRAYLLRYVHTFLIQSTQTSLAMRASVEQRLARWLLMVHDRAKGPRLELTHEFIGLMLGTRRTGVTIALNDLEDMALIESKRGVVTITDRRGLEELAGPYYGISETEYRRIMRVND
jgi:CRP-like cAMP-binding protein